MNVYSKCSVLNGEFKNDGKTLKKNLDPPPPYPPSLLAPTLGGVNLLNKTILTPTCIPQNDQRDVAIILKYTYWGTPPPPGRRLDSPPPPPRPPPATTTLSCRVCPTGGGPP